ncbi:hypothetical protein ALQ04_00571 [Pseudomonas cichorii]|uniref:Dermonecrotic toxin N-terminal domain-containing protein n=1 Tax=Pseudomonas cichorii TaxID=36746 RepID=A0A3M4LL37_PSECI|nr:DUF6543 domain-containing protein [Pseudomonas cichorii]RMQ41711.1 hypothetical protein ALQ04_00571 [Pseudomonas cichorii]
MPASTAPYFYSESLKRRFAQSLNEAVSDSLISIHECQWLKRLVETSNEIENTQPLPRVDRLVMDDGSSLHAELASALMFSDPVNVDGPVFLSTLLFGIERFESRITLLQLLNQRYARSEHLPLQLDVELIEGPLFEQQMTTILQHQMEHLAVLSDRLYQLPALQSVLVHSLQENLRTQLPDSPVNVFRDMVQTIDVSAPSPNSPIDSPVLDVQYLAGAVLSEYDAMEKPSTLERRFLAPDGQVLSAQQALPYVQALTQSIQTLPAAYEKQLADYWERVQEDGWTMKAFAGYALAEAYRQKLVLAQENGTLTAFECRRLRTLLPSPSAPPDRQWVRVHRIAVSVDGLGPVKLVGILLVRFIAGSLPGFYMFSVMKGFRRFASEQAVAEHFATPEGRAELLYCSSLNDHGLLSEPGRLQIKLDIIEHSLFVEHVGSIIALQKRNLAYVLGLPSASHRLASVQIDDALDIRGLLDNRLYNLHDSGRWRPAVSAQEQSLGLSRIPQGLFVDRMFDSDGLASWGEQLHEMDDLVRFLGQLHGGLASCIRHALNRYLAIADNPDLDARRLWVHVSGKGARNLLSLVLEKLVKADSRAWPDGRVLNDSSVEAVSGTVSLLPVHLLEQVTALVLRDFAALYDLQLTRFYYRPVRLLDTRIYPGLLSEFVRERALRLELNMERRRNNLDSEALDMLQQVLDRPVRRLREVFGNRCVDVHTLSLRLEGELQSIPLTNTFALCDSSPRPQYLMWALHIGARVFDSSQDMEVLINDWLGRIDHRNYVLDLMSEPDQIRVRRYCEAREAPRVVLQLERVDYHFTQVLESGESERLRQKCIGMYQRARTWSLEPEQFGNALDVTEREDNKRLIVGRLGVILQMMQGDELLSKWIKDASTDDQITLLEIWQRFYAIHDPRKDFLFDVPDLSDYARQQLAERLEADFPGQKLLPEQVIVTLTHYTPVPAAPGEVPQALPAATSRVRENLIDFSIDRLFAAQNGVISVSLEGGKVPDVSLTEKYIRNLVRSLDVASSYRLMVGQKLDEKANDYALRQEYYIDQIPSYELLRAFQLKLMNRLTLEGYDAIESVMTMPDGIARVPFKGRDIIISPLQLLRADSGWAPDNVTGVYVIAPKVPQQGPWLLYSMLNSEFSIKEYADRDALLADIHTSSTLQSFILSRLDRNVRHVYDNGGFQEPHLPFSAESSMDVPWSRPAPVQISITPYQGSALQLLFRGTLEAFKMLILEDSVSNAESDRAARYYLLGLLSEQILSFMPGRLGALVGVWQSRTLFQASLHAVADQHWGKAASEFTAALSMAIAARKNSQEDIADQIEEPEDILEFVETPMAFRWGNDVLSSEMQGRLRQLEVRDVALSDLHKDNLLNTYRDEQLLKEYVAIDGKVYQVELSEGSWVIVGSDRRGPKIKLNERQQWELDFSTGLKGGGVALSRFQSLIINLDIDRYIVVEAKGISEIRQVFRDRAELIKEGHDQARKYLENALDNLKANPVAGIDPRSERIISEFFGEPAPDRNLIAFVRQTLAMLYGSLMDPSLSPHDSNRFVVGINRLANQNSSAFVFVNDPLKRLFLTEKFFRLPYYRLKVSALRTREFNLGPHYRGTILLHELSHLCLDTEDIAYVDSHAPFVDLLDGAIGYRNRIKDEVIAAQQESLSMRTERSKLFSQMENGAIRDLKRSDGGAKAAVLRITGKRTLPEARDVFYTNSHVRSQIILKNADSVALLTTLLGRVNFASVP